MRKRALLQVRASVWVSEDVFLSGHCVDIEMLHGVHVVNGSDTRLALCGHKAVMCQVRKRHARRFSRRVFAYGMTYAAAVDLSHLELTARRTNTTVLSIAT